LILSDKTILEEVAAGRLKIEPFKRENVQPSSVDLYVSNEFRVFRHTSHTHIDLKKPLDDFTELIVVSEDKPYILQPGEFALGSTVESFELPDDIVGRLEGKSSLGRIGLLVHATAGFIDPGFSGDLTLELSNVSRLPIAIYPGMKIAQISFMRMTTPALRSYGTKELGSKYKGQRGPTESKYHLNFK
jgi:dCTP deaminase